MQLLRADDPRRLGDYQLLARLGEGGMGIVYLGRSPAGRAVAVKVIRERFAGDLYYRARFRFEASAAREVSGAFTAAVVDVSSETETPWLATVFLPGLSLREAVETFGVFPPAAAKVLGAGVAEALADIHRARIAHRDLKPGNIMLTWDGPRVIDFGIARPEEATAVTNAGVVLGTPAFMSPEQAAGESVGSASDVFSLGAVLAFAMIGRVPSGSEGQPGRARPWARMARAELRGTAALRGPAERGLTELTLDCLRPTAQSRPSADELLTRLAALGTTPQAAMGWLPTSLLDAIDERSERARDLLGSPSHRPGPPLPRRDVLVAPTVDPADEPGSSGGGSGDAPLTGPAGWDRPSRRALVLSGGVGAMAVAGWVAKLAADAWITRQPSAAATGNRPSASPSNAPLSAPPSPGPRRAAPRWTTKVSDQYPDVFATDSAVVAVTRESQAVALDPATGRVLWKKNAFNGAFVAGDLVFLRQRQQPRKPYTTVVSPASGAFLWATSALDAGLVHRPVSAGPIICIPLERDESSFRTIAVSSADGTRCWSADVDISGGLAAGPDIVVAAGSTTVVGLDPANGRTSWTSPLESAQDALWLSPLIGDGLVFITTSSGGLHAVSTNDGSLAWSTTQDNNGSLETAAGRLFHAGDEDVFAVDAASGTPRWSRTLGAGCLLRLSGETLVAACLGNGTVYGLAASDGRVLWTHNADMTRTSAPASTAGTAFIGTRAGNVEALPATPEGG